MKEKVFGARVSQDEDPVTVRADNRASTLAVSFCLIPWVNENPINAVINNLIGQKGGVVFYLSRWHSSVWKKVSNHMLDTTFDFLVALLAYFTGCVNSFQDTEGQVVYDDSTGSILAASNPELKGTMAAVDDFGRAFAVSILGGSPNGYQVSLYQYPEGGVLTGGALISTKPGTAALSSTEPLLTSVQSFAIFYVSSAPGNDPSNMLGGVVTEGAAFVVALYDRSPATNNPTSYRGTPIIEQFYFDGSIVDTVGGMASIDGTDFTDLVGSGTVSLVDAFYDSSQGESSVYCGFNVARQLTGSFGVVTRTDFGVWPNPSVIEVFMDMNDDDSNVNIFLQGMAFMASSPPSFIFSIFVRRDFLMLPVSIGRAASSNNLPLEIIPSGTTNHVVLFRTPVSNANTAAEKLLNLSIYSQEELTGIIANLPNTVRVSDMDVFGTSVSDFRVVLAGSLTNSDRSFLAVRSFGSPFPNWQISETDSARTGAAYTQLGFIFSVRAKPAFSIEKFDSSSMVLSGALWSLPMGGEPVKKGIRTKIIVTNDEKEQEDDIGFLVTYDETGGSLNLSCFTTFNLTLRPTPAPTSTPAPTTAAPSTAAPTQTEEPSILAPHTHAEQTPAPTASERSMNMEIVGTALGVFVIGLGFGYFVWYSLPGRTRTIGSNHPPRIESVVHVPVSPFLFAPTQHSTGVLPPRILFPAGDLGPSSPAVSRQLPTI